MFSKKKIKILWCKKSSIRNWRISPTFSENTAAHFFANFCHQKNITLHCLCIFFVPLPVVLVPPTAFVVFLSFFRWKLNSNLLKTDSEGFKYSWKAFRCRTRVSGLSKLFLAWIFSSIKWIYVNKLKASAWIYSELLQFSIRVKEII